MTTQIININIADELWHECIDAGIALAKQNGGPFLMDDFAKFLIGFLSPIHKMTITTFVAAYRAVIEEVCRFSITLDEISRPRIMDYVAEAGLTGIIGFCGDTVYASDEATAVALRLRFAEGG